MNAFRSSGMYQMRLSVEESKRSRARLLAARSVDSTFLPLHQQQQQQQQLDNSPVENSYAEPNCRAIDRRASDDSLTRAQDQQQLYDWKCEVSISSARASVMVYDEVNKKWVPSGSSSGLSKVQLYHHQVNNTFRVVGRKLQDHEIVMNCAILRGLKYNQATASFHQWRDSKHVYGLNFSSKEDADAFAKAMLQALDILSGNGTTIPRSLVPAPVTQQQQPQQQQQQLNYQQQQIVQQQQQQQQPNPPYEEDMGYRTMTREDVAIIQERRMSQQQPNQVPNGLNAISPSCPSNMSQQQQQQQQQQSGHHRTSSAPPAPAPQGQVVMQQQQQQMPPAPPPQPPAAPPAPPCPPSMMNFPGAIAQQYAQSPQSQQAASPVVGGIYGTTGGQPPQQPQQQQQQAQAAGYPVQQYAPNSQYGSRASLNSQYATLPSAASQYAVSQGPYGGPPVVSQQPQPQQPAAGSPVVVGSCPYGTPANSVNQAYALVNSNNSQPEVVNAYAPVASVVAAHVQSTVGPAPPPPPPMAPHMQQQQQQQQPLIGGGGGGGGAPPPPPPPPVPNAAGSNGRLDDGPPPAPDVNSLAAALQAKLNKKKQQSQPVENSGSSTSSSGSGNYGTLGRSGGGGDGGEGAGINAMMVEMAKTLARRRAAVEKKQPDQTPEPDSSPDKKSWDKSNSSISSSASNNKFSNGAESPKAHRKRFGSASEDTLLKVNGVNEGPAITTQDMEAFKAELMKEVRKEFQKIKQEIIDAVKSELNRR